MIGCSLICLRLPFANKSRCSDCPSENLASLIAFRKSLSILDQQVRLEPHLPRGISRKLANRVPRDDRDAKQATLRHCGGCHGEGPPLGAWTATQEPHRREGRAVLGGKFAEVVICRHGGILPRSGVIRRGAMAAIPENKHSKAHR